MNINKPTMSEEAARFWTAFFALLTTFALIGGGIYSVVQYFSARQADIAKANQDSQTYQFQVSVAKLNATAPFYSKYLDLCSEASEVVSTIATTTDTKKKLQATDDFWRLYWGPPGIVEDNEVEGAMISFGICLKGKCEGSSLRMLSLGLAHQCRAGVSKGWNLDLKELPQRPHED
jgi:hypothetical protein